MSSLPPSTGRIGHGRFTVIKQLAKGQFGAALLVEENPKPSTSPTSAPLSRRSGREHHQPHSNTKEDAYAPPPRPLRMFVVKQIMSKIEHSQEAYKAAMMEAKTIRGLQHHGIVQFHEAWDEGGHVYLRMEYCDGGDLQQLIQGQGARYARRPIPESRLLSYIIQILEATAYMHEHHVIHRDLKLANIFLTENQNLVKIGDFGLSKLLSTTDEAAKTQAGTPYYFSPELAKGYDYTTKTDIFSLGVLFYELMTRKKPFTGRNIAAVLNSTIRDPTPDIPAVVAKVWGLQATIPTTTGDENNHHTPGKKPVYSQELYRMVRRMLEKNPEHRPSAQQLLGAAVSASAVGRGIVVAPATTPSSGSYNPATVAATTNADTQQDCDHDAFNNNMKNKMPTHPTSTITGSGSDTNSTTTTKIGQLQHIMLAQPVVLNVRKEPCLEAEVVGKVSFRDQSIITVVEEFEQDNRVEQKALGGLGPPGAENPPLVPNSLIWYRLVRPVAGWMIADLGNGKPLFSPWRPGAPPVQRPTSPIKVVRPQQQQPPQPQPQQRQYGVLTPRVSPFRPPPDREASPLRPSAARKKAEVTHDNNTPTLHHHLPSSPVTANLSPRRSPLKNRVPLRTTPSVLRPTTIAQSPTTTGHHAAGNGGQLAAAVHDRQSQHQQQQQPQKPAQGEGYLEVKKIIPQLNTTGLAKKKGATAPRSPTAKEGLTPRLNTATARHETTGTPSSGRPQYQSPVTRTLYH